MALLNLGGILPSNILVNSGTETFGASLALILTFGFAFADKRTLALGAMGETDQVDHASNELSAKYDPADSQSPILARFFELKDYVARDAA